jgi:3-hydroxyacyl-CoA dehydrogenase
MKAYQILSNPNLGKIFPQTLQSVQAAKHAHLVIEAVPDRLDIKCR